MTAQPEKKKYTPSEYLTLKELQEIYDLVEFEEENL